MGVCTLSRPISYSEQSFYDYMNIQPSAVKGMNNTTTQHYKRILYNDLYGVFDFTLPDDWKLNWFRFWLFHFGSIAVIYTKTYGWIINPYTITELNYQYNPRRILVANAYLDKEYDGVIGLNAGIIHIFDDYFGMDGIISRFAERMADVEGSINVNIMNSRLSYLFYADNKKQADEIKELYGLVSEGNPLVTYKKQTGDDESYFKPFFNNVKQNYIASDLNDLQNAIRNQFLTLIGVPNANTDKKERLITNEVNANDVETKLLVNVMLENMRKSFDKINCISDLNLSVRYRYERSDDNAATDIVRNVSVR